MPVPDFEGTVSNGVAADREMQQQRLVWVIPDGPAEISGTAARRVRAVSARRTHSVVRAGIRGQMHTYRLDAHAAVSLRTGSNG
jgi:hypothetical protein